MNNNDYKYLMEESVSQSDSIRNKLFQLNSQQKSFTPQVLNRLKLEMMSELGRVMDSTDGNNAYMTQVMHLSKRCQTNCKLNDWNSQLYPINRDDLFHRFKVQEKCVQQMDRTLIDLNVCQTSDGNHCWSKSIEDSSTSTCSTNSNFSPKSKTCQSKHLSNNSSPTRVSGIFKRSKVNSPSIENKGTEVSRLFMTGLEKKLVEDVKNGSVIVNNAKKVLNQVRQQPFRNPMKSEVKSAKECIISDENLKNIDPIMIEMIENEIITNLEPIDWSKIAGLEYAKSRIKEIAILPLIRPELFQRIRRPPKGILLFGPPGTGKTLIGRCIASQTKSTFFSITVSSLTSKWIGEGEKMIKAMFSVARCKQPAVIFIDEIDSLLQTRNDTEHESSRRMKTEFLAQFEGLNTNKNERLLIIGATNRPQELDDAARRRLSTKLYIPLPDVKARKEIVIDCIKCENHDLTDEEIDDLAVKTTGYSGADMKDLCHESAMQWLRDSDVIDKIEVMDKSEVRGITYRDFIINLNVVKPSVSPDDLQVYEDWNSKYGTLHRAHQN